MRREIRSARSRERPATFGRAGVALTETDGLHTDQGQPARQADQGASQIDDPGDPTAMGPAAADRVQPAGAKLWLRMACWHRDESSYSSRCRVSWTEPNRSASTRAGSPRSGGRGRAHGPRRARHRRRLVGSACGGELDGTYPVATGARPGVLDTAGAAARDEGTGRVCVDDGHRRLCLAAVVIGWRRCGAGALGRGRRLRPDGSRTRV